MKKNILSLDGGGYRGLALLIQLVKFEENFNGKKYHEIFDYIAGTSTGGIIAVLLSVGYTAKEIMNFYLEYGDDIFNKKFLRFGLLRSKYSDKNLNNLLSEYLGDKKLSDCKSIILIPTYNVSKNEQVLFKSNKSNDNNFSLVDVTRSTASAPTYFNAWIIDNEYYIDGGLVTNNPSLMVLFEAIKNSEHGTKYNLLSFSTGHKYVEIKEKDLNGGIINGVDNIVDICLREQIKTIDYILEHLFKTLSRQLTGNNLGSYLRCETFIELSSGKIDDTSKENVKNMIKDGSNSFKKNKPLLLNFLANII